MPSFVLGLIATAHVSFSTVLKFLSKPSLLASKWLCSSGKRPRLLCTLSIGYLAGKKVDRGLLF